MRTWMTAAAVVIAAGMPATAAEPKAVVEAAIKAHGGKPALEKYPASKMNFKGSMSLMGVDVDFTGSATSADGGKTRMDMTAEVAGQKLTVLQVSNGTKTKAKVSLGGMDLPTPATADDDIKLAAASHEINKLYPLLDEKKFTLKAAPDADLDGKKASVVTVTVVDLKKDITLYFDQATGLLVKNTRKSTGPDGTESERETIMSDFKEVDGQKVSMKQTVYQGGAKFMTMTISDYKNLDKVDDKTFTIDD